MPADLSFLQDAIHLVAIADCKPIEALHFGADRMAAQIWADALNAQHYNIYWSVNVVRAGLNKKAAKRDIENVRYFHTDLDNTLDASKALHWRPTVLINSGGGFNMLWKVAAPTTVDVAEDINRRIEHALGADHCWNIDRVLSVPGTINWPNAAKVARGRVPVWSTLVQADNGVAYTADNMAGAFPPVPVEARQAAGEADVGDWTPLRLDDVPMPPQLRAMCEREAAKGERSEHVSKCCAALGYAGLNNAEIMGLLMHPDNSGLHPHIADQHNPERAARRKVALAEGTRPDPARAFATPAVVPSYVLSEPPPTSQRPAVILDANDHMSSARKALEVHFTNEDNLQTLRYWRGSFYLYKDGRYVARDVESIRALCWHFLDQSLCLSDKGGYDHARPNKNKVANLYEALSALAIIDSQREPPAWLSIEGDLPPAEE